MSKDDPDDPRFTPAEAQDAVHEFAANAHCNGVWNAVCKCGEIVGQLLAEYAKGHPVAHESQCCPYCHSSGPDSIKYVFEGDE